MTQALEHNSYSNAGDTKQGRVQDFKLRRAEGDAKIVGVFRVKNHDFTQKNQIFSNCRGRRENFGVFRVKNHDFTPKNNFCFSILGGRAPGTRPPHPESAPAKGRC